MSIADFPCHADHRRGDRRPCGQGRLSRHGRHDPRASSPTRIMSTSCARAGRRRSALRRGRLLRRPGDLGPRCLVRPQRRHQPGAVIAAGDRALGRAGPEGGRRRRRAGRLEAARVSAARGHRGRAVRGRVGTWRPDGAGGQGDLAARARRHRSVATAKSWNGSASRCGSTVSPRRRTCSTRRRMWWWSPRAGCPMWVLRGRRSG